jgi:hypothetical protein
VGIDTTSLLLNYGAVSNGSAMPTFSSSPSPARRRLLLSLRSQRSVGVGTQNLAVGLLYEKRQAVPLKAGGEMFFLWWLKSARRHLTQRHQIAEKELARSKALLAEDRRNIVLPLRAADQRNHFSDVICDALDVGYGPAGRKGVPGE